MKKKSEALYLRPSPAAPTELLVNFTENPLAIDNEPPYFTWVMNAAYRGALQSEFQIIVSSSRDKANREIGDVWDSGLIASSISSGVKYNGGDLRSDTRYWWKVRLKDENGSLSPYSDFATFDVGLSRSDWSASHIWDGTENVNNFAYFRKTFVINKEVSFAKIYISARDDFELSINGTRLGSGPARNDPDREFGQYSAYDMTPYLAYGKNSITVLGHCHGLYFGSGVNSLPGMIAQASIKYTDATSETIVTDKTWKALAATPYLEFPYVSQTADLDFKGASFNRTVKNFDARLEPVGWRTPEFDDSLWENATEAALANHLKAQYMPNNAEVIKDPVSIAKDGKDWIVDFGYCFSGWPKITMEENAPGSIVTIRYGEILGTFHDYDVYTARGKGVESWEPYLGGHLNSFRALKIEGYSGTLTPDKVKAVASWSKAEKAGSFNTSNCVFNEIYKICERSERQNIQNGIISVDAQREQDTWTADSYLIGMGSLYNTKNSMVLKKTVEDYAAEQLDNYNFRACSPAGDEWHAGELINWSFYWPLMLWEHYIAYNDEALIRKCYKNLNRFLLAYCESVKNSRTKLIDDSGWQIADFPNGGYYDTSNGMLTPTNCQYYKALKIAEDIANVLKKFEDAGIFAAKAEEVKNCINTYLFDGNEKYMDCYNSLQYHTLASSWALRYDIVPADKKEAVQKYISSRPFETCVYGTDCYINSLYLSRQADTAYAILNQKDALWGKMATDAAKSLACWEDWNIDRLDLAYNHAWSCTPAYFLQRSLMGIYPTSAGYASFDIRPSIEGGLTYAEAAVPTVKGSLFVRWEKKKDNRIALKAAIPANAKARVSIPVKYYSDIQIKEGTSFIWNRGAYIDGVEGIAFDSVESDYINFVVGSGDYSFAISGKVIGGPKIKTNDHDPAINYNGSWTQADNYNSYNNDMHYSNVKNSYAEFSFTGTSIKWIGEKASNRGMAEVCIDGAFDKTVDCYNPTSIKQQLLYENNRLSYGLHTIKVVVKGEKNPAANNAYIDIDAFESEFCT